jgi:murein DD-endopeptidase MepM/ murein hydrolase activator NlpD
MAGVKIEPYLSLPFRGKKFFVEEGWYYSKQENSIHHYKKHSGIDFKLKRWTPILAAHSGYALGSYQHNVRRYRGRDLLYRGRPVGFGYGYFVVIWNPELERGTLYGHCQKLSPRLSFIKPTGKFPNLKSGLYSLPAAQIIKRGSLVKVGQVIGWAGDQGCTWGYNDYPKRPNPKKFPSYDGVHLHFEEFGKNLTGQPVGLRDPFGIYKSYKQYPQVKRQSKFSLWI